MVMNRLEQGNLKGIAHVKDAECAIAESTRPISAHMSERCHKIARPWTGNAPFLRHEIKIANGLHQARICLLLGGDDEGPISWIRNVFEKVDRRKNASDDPN
ncbi:hypothetical protein [Microvirga sp. KLBC 81]|uniref:hypothetical protein n=1 Tax=Microvirga sp. KLBC 81 TaxID=1862707 RepID=UPI00352F26C4